MSEEVSKRHFPVPPLRLLMIAAGYKPSWIYGGPTISVSSLSEALAAEGVDVTVMTTNANGKDDFDYPNGYTRMVEGVKVIYFRRWIGDPVSVSPMHTWALLRSIRKYDLVHINGWWNWVAMMTLVICKMTRTPHVLTTRGALSEYTFQTRRTSLLKKIMHRIFFKRMLSHTFLHVTSEEEASRFRKALPGARVVVLPNIIHLYPWTKSTSGSSDHLNLVFLGRIDPVKNLELLVQSLNRVSFPYQLILIGDGEPGYVKRILNLSTAPKQIVQLGPVYDHRKYQYLSDADLLVLVSHSENFGNVVIEAMSQGTPVLLSRQVGLSAWVRKNQLGWVIEPEVASCIQALEEIYAHREDLDNMRDHVLRQVQYDFSTTTLVSRYFKECYQQINPKAEAPKHDMETV